MSGSSSRLATLTWRRSLLVVGAWQMRDSRRVIATMRNLVVSLPDRQAWSFDRLFLELRDSNGMVVAEGDRNAVLPTKGPAVVTSSSSEYELLPNTGSGLSVFKDGLEVAVVSRRGWMPVWRIDQTQFVLPLGLTVFVMAAMMRRSRAGRSIGRSDRRAVADARAGQNPILMYIFWIVIGVAVAAFGLIVLAYGF